jgi:hypothetical protein
MAVRRENDLANRRPPTPSLPATAGDTIAAVYSRCQWRHDLRIRHGQVMEPRREWWAQLTAWTAYILNQAGNDERWQEFYAAALIIAQERPLREIPLLKLVAEQTVMASDSRQIAA